MSQAGKILCAEHQGTYVLKLEGDVRLNLSATLDGFIGRMFQQHDFLTVMVDMTDAACVDSTTLGLLAKLALEAQKQHQFRPLMFSTNDDINRILDTMGFEDVFEIQQQAMDSGYNWSELPVRQSSESEVMAKVVEAHQVLSGMSEDNRLRFKDLLSALGVTDS